MAMSSAASRISFSLQEQDFFFCFCFSQIILRRCAPIIKSEVVRIGCLPFVVLLCGQCPCLYKLMQQQSHTFSSDGAVFKAQLNAVSHKYVQ